MIKIGSITTMTQNVLKEIVSEINTLIIDLFHKIHVSTDSIKIRNLCTKYGISSDFLRPKNLSRDSSSLYSVLKFVVEKYESLGKVFDEIWCILPASPLLTSNDLKLFSKKFKNLNSPMIVSSPYPAPLNWRFEIKNNLVTNVNEKKMRNLKLSKKRFFYDSGQVYCFNRSYFENKKISFQHRFYTFALPLEKSVDIDTEEDWKFAEILFQGLFYKSNDK